MISRLFPTVRRILVIVSVLLWWASGAVSAQSTIQDKCPTDLDWIELPLNSFTILYSQNNISLAQEISSKFGDRLETEFQNFSKGFEAEISVPISIRIYPSQLEYYCLNALAPVVGDSDAHSHIGSREIALFAEVINRDRPSWGLQAMNALRNEIAVLFGEHITDYSAPPGLLKGLGGYAEDPLETFQRHWDASGNISNAQNSWQTLWEEDVPQSEGEIFFQEMSMVAYLVDVFGWGKFISFLNQVGVLDGYRQAFLDVYGLGIQEIQEQWEQYFPFYTSTRWQANVIHHYDLSVFETLIKAGAYSDANAGLLDAIPLIDIFGTDEKLGEAELLLEAAKMGLQADSLTAQSRQAILSGDYSSSLTYAEQALRIFDQLGDTRKVDEIHVYRNISLEVITLRQELEMLKGSNAPLDSSRTERIVQIGRRLSQLGDKDGVAQVQITLLVLGSGQQNFIEWVAVVGLLVCVFIIWRRIRSLNKRHAPEAEIL